MDAALLTRLQRYLSGAGSREALARWLDGLDIWNGWQDGDADIEALRDVVGELDLVLTDVEEGFRDETELRVLAEGLVCQATVAASHPTPTLNS